MYDKIKEGLINGNKDHKSFEELIRDSIRFTFKKPVVLLFLGVFLFIVEFINDIFVEELDNPLSFVLIVILLVLSIILAIYESGYSYLIFEKSIEGLSIPPSLFNYKEILHHGIKDFAVVFVYAAIMLTIQMFISHLEHTLFYESYSFFLKSLSSFIGGFLISLMFIALINLAFNKGEFKSAFDFKELFQILYSVGLLRFIVILFIIDLADFLMVHNIGFFQDPIILAINVFLVLIITPSLLLFSKRLLIMSALH